MLGNWKTKWKMKNKIMLDWKYVLPNNIVATV